MGGKAARWSPMLSAAFSAAIPLTAPVSNMPVLLADKAALEPLLSETERRAIDPREPVESARRLSGLGSCAVRLIPYSTVGISRGLLLALRTDMMDAWGRVYKRALVAVSPTQLTGAGAYSAIIREDVC